MKKALLFTMMVLWAFTSKAQWVEQTSGSTHWFNSLYFVNETTGWICGFNGSDNMLIHTTDGGANWIPQPMPATVFLGEVTFLDANTGWAVGSGGVMYKSTDGGESWTPKTSGTTTGLQSVYFTDHDNGWAVGFSGKILHTTDGGETWTPQTSGVPNVLIRVRFFNSQIGWVAGWGGTILYTNNGGETWVQQTSNTTMDMIGISIVDGNNVWIGGAVGGGKGNSNTLFDNGVVLHTSNAGTTWETQYLSTEIINGVSFADLDNGWLFGTSGMIMHTSDGGLNWEAQYTGVSNVFTVGQFTDDKNGWTTGQDGIIMHTSNGGITVGINEEGPAGNSIKLSNSPNPFSGTTTIRFILPAQAQVEIAVYDVCGHKVETIANNVMTVGEHSIDWNASLVGKGMYICTLKADGKSVSTKMMSK